MTKSPMVSILVPCYNYAHLLPETLNSVLAQTMIDWECIIVNDGSKDNTRQIAQEYVQKDARFRYLEQENKGLSAARRTALKEAKGKYVQLLDADDLLMPEKLALHSQILNQNEQVDLVYSMPKFFYTNQPELLDTSPDVPTDWWLAKSGFGHELLPLFIVQNRLIVCTPLLKISILKSYFEQAKGGAYDGHEDWNIWLYCCIQNHYFEYLPSETGLIYYRLHPDNMSKDIQKMRPSAIAVRKFIQNKVPDAFKRQNEEYLQTDYIILGIDSRKRGCFWQGELQLFQAIQPKISLKRSLFAFVSLFLSGKKSEKVLKKITGQ